MNTVIDIGNTRVKVGYFEENIPKDTAAFTSNSWQHFYTFFSGRSVGNCIISSTVNVPFHILQYLKNKASIFLLLDEKTPLPLANNYKTKTTLGKDRIALAVGASYIFPEENVMVINAGTCITYNVIGKESGFSGGAISPGLQMRLQAMHSFTAQLPLAEIPENKNINVIGDSTTNSLLSGAINGICYEMEGFIKNIGKQFFPLKVILSGGDSRYLAKQLEDSINQSITIEPNLALIGLNQILHFNVSK